MKTHLILFLIPSILLYLTGCYSTREVGINELSSKRSPELYLKTKNHQFKFAENCYTISNDTLHGKGKYILNDNHTGWAPYYGKVAVSDAEEIQINKFNNFTSILFATVVTILVTGMFVVAELSKGSSDFNR